VLLDLHPFAIQAVAQNNSFKIGLRLASTIGRGFATEICPGAAIKN
jgi:hypothetical protein